MAAQTLLIGVIVLIIVVVVGGLYAAGVFKSGGAATNTGSTVPATTSITNATHQSNTTNGTVNSTTIPAVSASSGSLGPWESTTPYPLANTSSMSCAAANGYVYCVGGLTIAGNPPGSNRSIINKVYYAQLTSSGIGPWHAAPDYPYDIYGASCAADAYNPSYLACAGGFTESASLDVPRLDNAAGCSRSDKRGRVRSAHGPHCRTSATANMTALAWQGWRASTA